MTWLPKVIGSLMYLWIVWDNIIHSGTIHGFRVIDSMYFWHNYGEIRVFFRFVISRWLAMKLQGVNPSSPSFHTCTRMFSWRGIILIALRFISGIDFKVHVFLQKKRCCTAHVKNLVKWLVAAWSTDVECITYVYVKSLERFQSPQHHLGLKRCEFWYVKVKLVIIGKAHAPGWTWPCKMWRHRPPWNSLFNTCTRTFLTNGHHRRTCISSVAMFGKYGWWVVRYRFVPSMWKIWSNDWLPREVLM
jgi:hypothetical protein